MQLLNGEFSLLFKDTLFLRPTATIPRVSEAVRDLFKSIQVPAGEGLRKEMIARGLRSEGDEVSRADFKAQRAAAERDQAQKPAQRRPKPRKVSNTHLM